jgi:hypothetical protein
MCVDPYKIAQYARKIEIDQRETLKHIHISRAFTVFQLTTLIQDMLEQAIMIYNPKTLVIGKISTLYLSSDVSYDELQILLKNDLKKIKEFTIKYDLITILSNLDNRLLSNSTDICKKLYENADEVIRMKQVGQRISVDLQKNGEAQLYFYY